MESASLPRTAEEKIDRTIPLAGRHFTIDDREEITHPYDTVEWDRRDCDVRIYGKMKGLEFPTSWSQNTANIVAGMYFSRGAEPEDSVKQMIDRVAMKITREGIRQGHLPGIYEGQDPGTPGTQNCEATRFYDELRYILVNQMAAFNSPVWFNVGRSDRKQQCSACFLLAIDDNTDSIMKWATDEAFIFKGGSGAGINLSPLRGSSEPLSTGGTASGPVSFMRVADSVAGTFKSGGTTRRAAKLVVLNVDHPDIREFIWCKAREEDRLRQLIELGVRVGIGDAEMERNLAELTAYQNANNSVRVTNEFMEAVLAKTKFALRPRKGGEVEYVDASDLLDEIAKAAWECADPGMQYHDTINLWHTTPSLGPINTSNPCNEVHQNDNTSCNLASINVLKFLDDDGSFRVEDFRHTVDIMSLAMEITCGFSHLPTDELERNTRDLRQLGLGYTNMGAAIMAQGLPYDSDEARCFASSVTALMTGRAYHQSARVARKLGAFKHYHDNRSAMLRVISMHKEACLSLVESVSQSSSLNGRRTVYGAIAHAASEDWCQAKQIGLESGYRNSQVTVLAPTGTISFLLGADTTGIEPAFRLVSHKTLAGGGTMKLINGSVRQALERLGYVDVDLHASQITEGDFSSIEEAHLPVFATAVGENIISPAGHLKMLAAVQPFLSGAASKTVNLPETATAEEIRELYVEAWKMGIKAVAIYRDGSKAQQPLTSIKKESSGTAGLASHSQSPQGERQSPRALSADGPATDGEPLSPVGQPTPFRRRMPRTRQSITHKFSIAGHEGYINAGMYEDGTLGEIFVSGLGKEGSTLTGVIGAWAIAISMGLQYGVPLEDFVRKYAFMRFDPEGLTEDPEIRNARSIVDYIMRWLAARFLSAEIHEELGIMTPEIRARKAAQLEAEPQHLMASVSALAEDPSPLAAPAKRIVDLGPACSQCGSIMQRTGTCYTCADCGNNTGCG